MKKGTRCIMTGSACGSGDGHTSQIGSACEQMRRVHMRVFTFHISITGAPANELPFWPQHLDSCVAGAQLFSDDIEQDKQQQQQNQHARLIDSLID